MKLKHLLVVGLVLAILTMGAVSASDDADNLTVSNSNGDEMSQVEEAGIIDGDEEDFNVESSENNCATSETEPMIVDRMNPELNISSVEFNYGATGNVNFQVTDGVAVDAENVTVDGHPEAEISIEENKVIHISGLGAGTYTLNVVTTPNENFNSVTGNATITVKKVMPTISVSFIEYAYGETGTSAITTDGASIGSYYVVSYPEAKVEFDGNIISVSGLDARPYPYTLEINGIPDGNHNNITVTTMVRVNMADSKITISDVEYEPGKSGNATFTVDGATVDWKNITVEGHDEAIIGLYGNSISISGLDAGVYTLKVTTTPDKNYNSVTGTATITVLFDSNLTISVADIEEGSDAVVFISTNETFSGDVKVKIAGSNYTVGVLNGKGNVTVKGLAVNTYEAVAIFDQSDLFKASEIKTKFTVKAKSGSGSTAPVKKVNKITLKLAKLKKVKKSAKKIVLKATLKINGKAVKGKKLKFKFNKKTYTARTNAKGVAKVIIKKKVLKKLKVGKKVKYQVSYGKKTVKKSVKVKR